MSNKSSNILIYQTEDGQTKVQVHLQDESVWLSLNQMAELFQRDKSVISRHIRNIFKEGELSREGRLRFIYAINNSGASLNEIGMQFGISDSGVSLASYRFSETLKGSRRLRKKIGEIHSQLNL